jgi:two-component system, cell cycle sensor histidine kinase and response regulator CckA
MTRNNKETSGSEDLRPRAEARLQSRTAVSAQLSPEETQSLVHELQVHQIELEMQNDHLREAQVAVEAALTRYADFYDFAPVAYLTLDERGLILEANLTAAIMLGVERTRLLQRPVTIFILKEDRQIYFRHRQSLFETQEPQHYELRLVRQDGASFWAGLATITVSAGNKTRVCKATISDITERKQAEEALRGSEERYRSLIVNTINAVALHEMLYDSEGRPADYRFLMVNPAFEDLTGFSSEQVVGKTVLQILPGLDPFWIETYGRVVVTGAPVSFERYEENLKRHFQVTAYKTEAHQFAAIFSDITEQKELEDQFLQSQKMEAVGRLAGGVAHDFNNMLNVIFGYSDLINQELHQDDPLARYLTEIRQAADRAAALTRQLLAFSRKTILAPQIVNLNDHLAGIERMLARLIGEDIEMRMGLEPALGAVKADPGHIDQIVMNLVINARDAMPMGGKLTLGTANFFFDQDYVRRHVGVTAGQYVMLAVTDNGQGMDAATQARVFEPFFTTKELGRGTGLGLSTVYGIVKQSGGHVEVYSEVGHGTTVKVYLPRVQDAVAAAAARPATGDLHGSETILVVEDEDILRDLISRSLTFYGHTVLVARHGGEALLLCERHPGPIHLLLTDVIMPQMSGRDLAERLASLRPDMKVLYMSGYTENAIVHHGVLETNVDFIPKPFRIKTLLEKIREIFPQRLRQP